MYLPIAHAEGKFVPRDKATLDRLMKDGQVPLVYRKNPNGSIGDIAAVCDPTGRVCGLMPHPERHIDPTQHPRWTRGEAGEVGDGLRVFENAVRYFG
jgi:phosphoribosylformylglycinamidine synthase